MSKGGIEMCSNCLGNFVLSVILSALFAILVGTGVATILPSFLFGGILVLSVLFLVLFISTLLSPNGESDRCFCRGIGCLVWGFVVAIVTSVVALALTFAAALSLVVLAIFVFIASTAFLTGLFSFVDLIVCIARKRCCN